MVRTLFLGLVGLGFLASAGPSTSGEKPPAQPQPGAENDPLPKNAVKRFGTGRLRHGSRILSLAYVPNGRILAAGGGDDPVRLWNADTGEQIREIKEPWVHAIAFSPRGSIIVTAGAFKTIRIWETATGKEATINKLEGHTAPVKAMVISPDGSMIASGSQDGVVILWELSTGKQITQFKGHTDEITSLAFSADSNSLVSGSSDRSVRIWDAENAKHIKTLDGGCAVQAVAFMQDGAIVASGGDDQIVRLWDVKSGKELQQLKGHKGTITNLAASRDGKTLYSGAFDKTIRQWDSAGKEGLTIARDLGDSDAMALTKDGKFLATAGSNNTIRMFETATGKETLAGPGHQAAVTSMAMSKNGKYLVSGSTMGKIRLWDPATGKEIRNWACPNAGDLVLAFSPDGQYVVSANGNDAIRFWDPETGQEKFQLEAVKGDTVLCLTFSPDGSKIAVGRRNQAADLWDWKEKKIAHTFKYPGPVYALAFTQDGETLAASGAKKVALYETGSGKEIRQFSSKEEGPPASMPEVASLAFSHDGKSIAVGCYDAMIRILDTAKGKELRVMEGHGNVAYALAFSNDGRTLASASFDRTVRLWEAFSGLPIAVLQGHRGSVNALAFAANGRGVFSAGADTAILLWDVTAMSKDGKLPMLNLNPQDLQTGWTDLAAEDAPRAHQALWRHVSSAKESVEFAGKSLYFLDPKKVDQLFADLNSEKYDLRTKATAELEKYGRWMEGRLRELQKNPPTLEVQRRVDKLLTKLDDGKSLSLNQERLRVHRVLLILEQIATPEAIGVLERLAKGAPEADLQRSAQASLDRLAKRAKSE